MTYPADLRAHIVGLGLIGGSVGLALLEQGWSVTGSDHDAAAETSALELGVISGTAAHPETSLIFVCTPAGHVVNAALGILKQFPSEGVVVTDVAGVKGSIASQIVEPRFIGGHPMAGSEMRGSDGARAKIFTGGPVVL